METILNQMLSWFTDIIGGLLDLFSQSFLAKISPDLQEFNNLFSFITSADVRSFMTTFGLMLTLILCVWGLFKGMFGKYMDTDSPIQIVAWGMGMGCLILWGDDIYDLFLGVAKPAFNWINGIQFQNPSLQGFSATLATTLSGFLTNNLQVGTFPAIKLVLSLISMIYLGWQYLKVLLESVERYVIMAVLYYTSPIAYSMGTTKQTRKVLQNWFRMVLSNLFLLVINVWFIRGFCYGFGNLNTALNKAANVSDVILNIFLLGSFLKVGSSFDRYLQTLGVTTAQTGGGLVSDMIATAMGVKTLKSAASGVISKFSGGSKSGGNSGGSWSNNHSNAYNNSRGQGIVDTGWYYSFGDFRARQHGGNVSKNSKGRVTSPNGFVTRFMFDITGKIMDKANVALDPRAIANVLSGTGNTGKLDVVSQSMDKGFNQMFGGSLNGWTASNFTGENGHFKATINDASNKTAFVEGFSANSPEGFKAMQNKNGYKSMTDIFGNDWILTATGKDASSFI